MKRFVLSRGALSVCTATFVLLGCGGSQGLIGQSATGQRATAKQLGYNPTAPDFSGSEVLSASYSRIHARCYQGLISFTIGRFRAQGNATGPFPGTFTAEGGWDDVFSFPYITYLFRESFTITSGPFQISGRVLSRRKNYAGCAPAEFGPATLNYRVHSGIYSGHKGQVQISVIKRNDFSETLSRFRK